MSNFPRNEKGSKRQRTTEDESLFTDVTIPLSLPSLPRTIQPCELASEELGVRKHQETFCQIHFESLKRFSTNYMAK